MIKPTRIKLNWRAIAITTNILAQLALLASVAFTSLSLIKSTKANQSLEKDRAELSDIRYGLFNMNLWTNRLSRIIRKEISGFEITKDQGRLIKPMLEEQIDRLILSIYKEIKESNKDSVTGKIKQMFIDTTIDLGDIRRGVPQYADDVILLLQQSKSKQAIKTYLVDQVDPLLKRNYSKIDEQAIDRILDTYQYRGIKETKLELSKKIEINKKTLKSQRWLIIGLCSLIFIFGFISARYGTKGFSFIVMLAASICLLLCGIFTPMISLEAKIAEMSLTLLDEPIRFENQYLYYQSKSIMDVFFLMIKHHSLEMKAVGILMVSFSVIFPIIKLSATVLSFARIKSQSLLRPAYWLMKNTGKWSMADVFIVAIFMSYIGFNGILDSQLGGIDSPSESVSLITTNGTELQSGFYLFFAYVIASMLLGNLGAAKVNSRYVTENSS